MHTLAGVRAVLGAVDSPGFPGLSARLAIGANSQQFGAHGKGDRPRRDQPTIRQAFQRWRAFAALARCGRKLARVAGAAHETTAPGAGRDSPYIRAYWGEEPILDGSWQPPKIVKTN